jgi:hypothetical protein
VLERVVDRVAGRFRLGRVVARRVVAGFVVGRGRQPVGNFRQSVGGTTTRSVIKCHPADVLAIILIGTRTRTRNMCAIVGSLS